MPVFAPLDQLIYDFGKIPPGLRRELRPALRRTAQPILADAKRRASWSSRIPGAITVRSSFSARSPGLRLVVNATKAPHARPYEGGSHRNNRSLRHPVFGHTDRWVSEPLRPFFFPAVEAGRPRLLLEAGEAIDRAARAAGFTARS